MVLSETTKNTKSRQVKLQIVEVNQKLKATLTKNARRNKTFQDKKTMPTTDKQTNICLLITFVTEYFSFE